MSPTWLVSRDALHPLEPAAVVTGPGSNLEGRYESSAPLTGRWRTYATRLSLTSLRSPKQGAHVGGLPNHCVLPHSIRGSVLQSCPWAALCGRCHLWLSSPPANFILFLRVQFYRQVNQTHLTGGAVFRHSFTHPILKAKPRMVHRISSGAVRPSLEVSMNLSNAALTTRHVLGITTGTQFVRQSKLARTHE